MNLKKLRDTIYNNVWHAPKGKLSEWLKAKCDNIPQNRRMPLVIVLLSLFVLTAFISFGHACYRIGLGKAQNRIEVEHIESLKMPEPFTPGTPSPILPYDD